MDEPPPAYAEVDGTSSYPGPASGSASELRPSFSVPPNASALSTSYLMLQGSAETMNPIYHFVAPEAMDLPPEFQLPLYRVVAGIDAAVCVAGSSGEPVFRAQVAKRLISPGYKTAIHDCRNQTRHTLVGPIDDLYVQPCSGTRMTNAVS
jgi:hypothetical protein